MPFITRQDELRNERLEREADEREELDFEEPELTEGERLEAGFDLLEGDDEPSNQPKWWTQRRHR